MITAKIIADSTHKEIGTRITTFELTFPRWILAEFNTHRLLSRNSASSRAIPIKANIENILKDTAIPVHWGKNQAGMVADEEVSSELADRALGIWLNVRDGCIKAALELNDIGIHKQIANRLIENFTYQKVIVTATEWDNFFWLRSHKDAQPEIKVLSDLMLKAYNESVPSELDYDEWHTPYVEHVRTPDGVLMYLDCNGAHLTLDDALKVSASCCAQVSYRKQDDSVEKAIKVFDMLNLDAGTDINDARKHSSPIEHQATPMSATDYLECINGATHETRDGSIWSGNFKDWVQARHLYDNESCKKHPEIRT
jgi:thymidylate synthase ThyX